MKDADRPGGAPERHQVQRTSRTHAWDTWTWPSTPASETSAAADEPRSSDWSYGDEALGTAAYTSAWSSQAAGHAPGSPLGSGDTQPLGYGWPPPPPPVRTRSVPGAPGWGAVVVIAAVVALVAGAIGGVVGGIVGQRGGSVLDGGSTLRSTPTPGPGSTERPSGSIANIAATALPSVVTIMVRDGNGGATGSGFVLDDNGHIITNNHVVADAAGGGQIVVQLANGKQLEASLVGRDASYDVAVLDVRATNLTPLPIGSSDDVVVGDQVIAVGAPLGLDSTVTSGIVSALGRPVSAGDGSDRSFINAIQTDAAINPGNSGGPLLDMQGRVVGINSAIAQPPGASLGGAAGSIGLGFAIPSDQVRKTAEQLIRNGKAVHPVIGVVLDATYTGEGVRVLDQNESDDPVVTPGGPADKAGLRPGDIITAFDGHPVTGVDELVVSIRAQDVGDAVTLTVRRNGREIQVKMTLQGSTD